MASEMVEKAATAILVKVPLGYGMTRPEAVEYARAAIEALRIATIDMRIAAQQRQIDCGFVESPNGLWTVMVDAALAEAGK